MLAYNINHKIDLPVSRDPENTVKKSFNESKIEQSIEILKQQIIVAFLVIFIVVLVLEVLISYILVFKCFKKQTKSEDIQMEVKEKQ